MSDDTTTPSLRGRVIRVLASRKLYVVLSTAAVVRLDGIVRVDVRALRDGIPFGPSRALRLDSFETLHNWQTFYGDVPINPPVVSARSQIERMQQESADAGDMVAVAVCQIAPGSRRVLVCQQGGRRSRRRAS